MSAMAIGNNSNILKRGTLRHLKKLIVKTHVDGERLTCKGGEGGEIKRGVKDHQVKRTGGKRQSGRNVIPEGP